MKCRISAGILLAALLLSACSGKKKEAQTKQAVCHAVEVKGGFGYCILSGKDTLIYQPFIPAIGGKRPFSSKSDALRVGEKICNKLNQGEMPVMTKEEISCLLNI